MRNIIITSGWIVLVFCIIIVFFALPHQGNAVNANIPTFPTTIQNESINHPVETIPYQALPELDTNIKNKTTHILTFVGDCTLGTMPEWMSYSGCFNRVIGENYDHPFNAVRTYFEDDDCTFINLEGVLGMDGTAQDKQFTFRGPIEYIQILTGSSVEIANLSNNHTYDFGQAGYNSTVQVLKDNCIPYIGRNETAVYTTQSGLTIGMYGVYFNLDTKDMAHDIQMLKDIGADIIVAACHWGIEREYQFNATQQNIAHKLIDAGVDIVWGHHPHVLQPIELYNDGIIYYSLGNFSFGGNHNPSDKDTVVIQQTIVENEDGTFQIGGFTAIPCRLSSKEAYNDFQPTPYTTEDVGYQRTLSKLGLSTSINGATGAAHGTSGSILGDIEDKDTH